MTETATKAKILAAAEKLFATKGIAATSLRTIIKEAGVNTASVHYHFGSKEGLIETVLSMRANPINEERLRMLRDLERSHPTGALPLEGIIHAFVTPVVRMRFDPSGEGTLFPRVMARIHTEAIDSTHNIFRKIFGDVFATFTQAFKRTLPHLSDGELMWRIHMMIGAMAFTLAIPGAHSPLLPEDGDRTNVDRLIQRLTTFVAAGMRESIPTQSGKDD